jgi:hypothetical protein
MLRKKNHMSHTHNLNLALSGEGYNGSGLLLAGQTRPNQTLNYSPNMPPVEPAKPKPAIKPKLIPAPVVPKQAPKKTPVVPKQAPKKTTGIVPRMSSNPNRDRKFKPAPNLIPRMSSNPDRSKNFKLKQKKIKGGPINIKLGQYQDLVDAFEAGDSTPFISEIGSTLGELALGLL